MSQETASRLRAGYELLSRGTIDVELLAADFELVQASSIIDSAGVFRGRDAVREAIAEVQGSFDELEFAPEEIIDVGHGQLLVLVHVDGRGRASGLAVDDHIAHLWTFRDDKAVRLVIYEEQADALKAVGRSGRGVRCGPPDTSDSAG
jgi:ketosteroid isomerase-like protein